MNRDMLDILTISIPNFDEESAQMQRIASEVTPEECAGEILEVVPLIMRFIRAEMRSQGQSVLSVPQLRAMFFLNRFPGSCLSNVAEHLGVTKATASTLVDKLVHKDLIHRIENPQERRRHILTLTDSGNLIVQQARQATRSRIASALTHLSENQLAQIKKGLILLGDIFQDK